MRATESPHILRCIARAESAAGKPVVVRGVRFRNPLFRGRIQERAGRIIVEHRDDTAGYFWHYQLIEELLEHVTGGRRNVVVYEGDVQFEDVALDGPASPGDDVEL